MNDLVFSSVTQQLNAFLLNKKTKVAHFQHLQIQISLLFLEQELWHPRAEW